MLFDYDQSDPQSTSEILDCPDEFDLVEASGGSSNFCISNQLLSEKTYNEAINFCENQIQVNQGFISNLCHYDQWIAACAQNPEKYVGSEMEWVFEVPGVGNELSASSSSCIDVPQEETSVTRSYRCCVSVQDRVVGNN